MENELTTIDRITNPEKSITLPSGIMVILRHPDLSRWADFNIFASNIIQGIAATLQAEQISENELQAEFPMTALDASVFDMSYMTGALGMFVAEPVELSDVNDALELWAAIFEDNKPLFFGCYRRLARTGVLKLAAEVMAIQNISEPPPPQESTLDTP
jgi:hypothetical protein